MLIVTPSARPLSLNSSTSSFSAFSQGGTTTNTNKSKSDSTASRHIRFLREIPVDPMTGKAFEYRLDSDVASLHPTPYRGRENDPEFNKRYEVTITK